MTITYDQVFSNITFSNLSQTEEDAAIEALNEIEQTEEGRAFLQALKDEHGTVDLIFTDVGSFPLTGSHWNNFTDELVISLNDIYRKSYFGADGEEHHFSLQHIILHEGYHGIENTLLDGPELDEGRAIQFTNEYMAKYYGETRRAIWDNNLLSQLGLPDNDVLLSENFDPNGHCSYSFLGESGEDIVSLVASIDADEFDNNQNNYIYKILSNHNDVVSDTITSDYKKATDGALGESRISNDDSLDTSETKIIYSFSGNDTITIIGDDRIVYTGEGDDTVYGNGSDSTIIGGRGNDSLDAGGSSDTDELRFAGDFGQDTVSGGEVIVVDGDTLDGSESGILFDADGDGLLIAKGNNTIRLTDWAEDGDYGITVAGGGAWDGL